MKLSRTTWATLAVFAALVIFYLLVLSAAQVYYVPTSPAMSTHNTTEDGLAALYRYLAATGVPVERLTQYETLPEPEGTVMISAGPLVRRPNAVRVERLKEWVEAGGRLVIAAEESNRFHELVGVRPMAVGAGQDAGEVQATGLTNGVESLSTETDRVVADLPDDAVVHIGAREQPKLASMKLGKGTVVVLSDEWAMSNEGIREGDNLQLALNMVAPPGAQRVVFDEYHHGYATGGGAWTRLPVAAQLSLVQLALAALILVMAGRTRLGIPQASVETARRSPAEYVESLASLLKRAKASDRAARVLDTGFERILAARLGTAVRDRDAARSVLAARKWDDAARALGSLGRPVDNDDDLVRHAKTMADGRREVSGADRRRSGAR